MRLALAAVLVGIMALPTAVGASCVARDWLVGELAERHGELKIAEAVTENGDLLELLASAEGKTWTLLITRPSGLTCDLIEGENLREPLPALALAVPPI